MSWTWIAVLWLVGAGCVVAEVFTPGLVLGVIGALALVAAVTAAFASQGPLAGVLLGAGSLVFGGVVVRLGLRRVAHEHRLTAQGGYSSSEDRSELVGLTGVALTVLRPGGFARIGGQKIDVVTGGEHVEAGVTVEVTAVEGNRVVVRQR